MKLRIKIILADCHIPLLHVVVVVVVVGVGCGGNWVTASLVKGILLADQPLVLVEGVLTGVVAAAGDTHDPPALALADLPLVLQKGASAGVIAAAGGAMMLPTLLSFTHTRGEVWVPALVIFSVPIPPWCTLSPSKPGISVLYWS